MRVEVTCFGVLRDHLPNRTTNSHVEIAAGGDVEALITGLGVPPRSVFQILVNDERGEASLVLREGDRVTLMPPFSGGAV